MPQTAAGRRDPLILCDDRAGRRLIRQHEHRFFFSSRRRHTRFKCDWSSDVCSSDLVSLQIDKDGHVSKKLVEVRQQSQLRNTLLEALYPGLQVASVDVPQEPLDPYEQAIVEHALQDVECEGVRYRLIGASGSAKKGKFYAADVAYEKKLAERFRESPQAAITYFGILVSSCSVRIDAP